MSERAWPSEQPVLGDGDIVLRPWTADDADAVYQACQDRDIQRFTTVPSPYSIEDALGFVTTVASGAFADEAGLHLALSSRGNSVLGAVGLDVIDAKSQLGEAGYWIAPSTRGRGLASRALALFAQWAFVELQLAKLELHIELVNTASVAVAERAGAGFERLLPEPRLIRGKLREMAVYSLVPNSAVH